MVTDNGTGCGGSIRELRLNLGLSQEALARRADCSTVYIAHLERGYLPRHSDVLPRVMAVLNEIDPGVGAPRSMKPSGTGGGYDSSV
jgi:predicted transcriptional regulator